VCVGGTRFLELNFAHVPDQPMSPHCKLHRPHSGKKVRVLLVHKQGVPICEVWLVAFNVSLQDISKVSDCYETCGLKT